MSFTRTVYRTEVHCEILLARITFITMRTSESFFSSVGPLMSSKVWVSYKYFITVTAFIELSLFWSLLYSHFKRDVDHFMFRQRRTEWKTLFTQITFIRLLACVNPLMYVEITDTEKTFATIIALERFFLMFSVRPSMSGKSWSLSEASSTLFALEGLFPGVSS